IHGLPAAVGARRAAGRLLGRAGVVHVLGRGAGRDPGLVVRLGRLLPRGEDAGPGPDPPLRALLLPAGEEVAAGGGVDPPLTGRGHLLRATAPRGAPPGVAPRRRRAHAVPAVHAEHAPGLVHVGVGAGPVRPGG